MKSAVFRLIVGITCVSVFGLVSFGSAWNMTQARGTRCNERMTCHILCHALWSRQISWPATRLLASRNDFLSLAPPHLLSCLSPIHPSIHVWRYSPFWAQASLKRRLLCPHLAYSILVFLGPVMHVGNVLPCRSWFSHWFVLWNFPLRTSFEILFLFSWCDVLPMFVGFPKTWG